MAEIHFGNKIYPCAQGESALDTLLRYHVQVPWSCRAGLCHSCIMQATQGHIPAQAQQGLTTEQKTDGLLLACQCVPETPITLQLLHRNLQPVQAIITKTRLLTPTLIEITLSPSLPLTYRPGQFLSLSRSRDQPGNLYTLVSRPWAEPDLRIQVARRVGGQFSSWLFDEAKPCQTIWLRGPDGECCFHPDQFPVVLFGADHGIGAALAVAEDILWHETGIPVTVLITGETDGYSQERDQLSATLSVNTADNTTLHKQADMLRNDPRFKDAQWLMFGKAKTVIALAEWLSEQGVAQKKIVPLPYH